MILVEFTPSGGTLQRISTEDIDTTYQWFSYINNLPSMTFSLTKKHGGYARPGFSDLQLSPEMFETDWPPPKTADIKIIETETDETEGVVIFDGTAQRYEYDRAAIGYNLHHPEFSDTISSSTAYNDTLVNVMTSLSTLLGLTINTTAARATSPAVLHTTATDQQAIDLMDDMCSFFSHGFKIVESVLYLYDMLGTTTAIDLTEFDAQPSSYRDDRPISLVSGGGQSVAGSSPNGDEYGVSGVYHTTAGNIITALTDIKTIIEYDVAVINAKINKTKPGVLDTFTFYDESTINPLTSTCIAVNTIYNYDTLDLQIEGIGTVL